MSLQKLEEKKKLVESLSKENSKRQTINFVLMIALAIMATLLFFNPSSLLLWIILIPTMIYTIHNIVGIVKIFIKLNNLI